MQVTSGNETKTSRKIVILGTGGTIAGSAANAGDHTGYKAAQLAISDLVAGLPAPSGVDFQLQTEQVAQVDSKDMDVDIWFRLASRVACLLLREEVQGIVITHGTDTLEETAFFLQSLLKPAKAVVLTCAMRPATALSADGPQNILDAISVAGQAGATGVVVACAGVIHAANDVQKVHNYRLNAFGSGDAGPVGYVEEGRLKLVRNWPVAQDGCALEAIEKIAIFAKARIPRVEIVMSHAGAGGALVEALIAQGVDGLVVAGTGNGTVHHALEAALLKAQQNGVSVVRATRCAEGQVIAKPGAALLDSRGLSPVKARIAMMLALLEDSRLATTHTG